MNQGAGIRRARRGRHVSQQKLAIDSGIELSRIVAAEEGRAELTGDEETAICQALGVPVSLLRLLGADSPSDTKNNISPESVNEIGNAVLDLIIACESEPGPGLGPQTVEALR